MSQWDTQIFTDAAALSAKLGTWVAPRDWTAALADKEREDPSL